MLSSPTSSSECSAVVVGGEAAEDAAVVVGRRRLGDALLRVLPRCRAAPTPCRPARARTGSSRSGPRSTRASASGTGCSLPENSQSASDAIELLNASVPPTPAGRVGRRGRVRRRRADVHAQRDAGVVAHLRTPGPSRRCGSSAASRWCGQLAEAERAHAAIGVALDLRGRELDVPQRHDAERDVHAARRRRTTPRPSSRCTPARTRARAPCRRLS